MARIPMYDQRVRERAMPNVSGGPRVNADSFGAGAARDILRLGGELHGLGDEAVRQTHVKQRVLDEAILRDQTTQLHEKFSRDSQAIYQKKGIDAAAAEREVSELTDRLNNEAREAMSKNSTEEQRREWDRRFSAFKSRQVEQAISFSANQTYEYDRQTLEAQNMQAVRDAQTAEAKHAGDPMARDMEQQLSEDITLRSVEQLTVGMPPEQRALARTQALHTLYSSIAQTRSLENPKAAIEYLDQEKVKSVFTPAEHKALKDKYKEANDVSVDSQWAFNLVNFGASDAEIMERAYAEYPNDQKRAEFVINLASRYRGNKINEQNTKAAEANGQAWQAFAESKYDITTIPKSLQVGNPKLYQSMVEYSGFMAKLGEKQLDPDIFWVDQMLNKKPSEVKAFLADEKNYQLAMLKSGNATEMNRLREWARKDDSVMQGSGSGTGGGNAGFKPSEWFENAYPVMNPTVLWGVNTFSAGGDTAKEQRNGFVLRFNDRLKNGDGTWEGEDKASRKATYAEQQEIATRLTADVVAKRVDLKSTYYDERLAAETKAPEMPVASDQVTPEQSVYDYGKGFVDIRSSDGEVARFAVGDPASRNLHANIAQYNPEKVIRATGRGVLNGIAYEDGWQLAQVKGRTLIFDERSRLKDVVYLPAVSQSMTEETVAPEPEKSTKMKQLEKQGVVFNWEGASVGGVWTGDYPDGTRKFFDQNAREIRGNAQYGVAQDTREYPLFVERLNSEVSKLHELEDRIIRTREGGSVLTQAATIRRLQEQVEKQKKDVAELQNEYGSRFGGQE